MPRTCGNGASRVWAELGRRTQERKDMAGGEGSVPPLHHQIVLLPMVAATGIVGKWGSLVKATRGLSSHPWEHPQEAMNNVPSKDILNMVAMRRSCERDSLMSVDGEILHGVACHTRVRGRGFYLRSKAQRHPPQWRWVLINSSCCHLGNVVVVSGVIELPCNTMVVGLRSMSVTWCRSFRRR
jgi:hypothetical protein